jgi:Maltokinase N-terminal cap domain
MGVIYTATTMIPSKVELLTTWLPAQPWYAGPGGQPELTKVGGFRVDDPAGEVGIEFMAITDSSGGQDRTYHAALTYRGSPYEDLASSLVGTAEHGALGRRWVYDGTRDPLLVAQLVALIQGAAPAQAQSKSYTLDPTVISQPVPGGPVTVTGSEVVSDGPAGTELRVTTADDGGAAAGDLSIRVNRVLRPVIDDVAGPPGQPGVSATWRLPDGRRVRGVFASAGRG